MRDRVCPETTFADISPKTRYEHSRVKYALYMLYELLMDISVTPFGCVSGPLARGSWSHLVSIDRVLLGTIWQISPPELILPASNQVSCALWNNLLTIELLLFIFAVIWPCRLEASRHGWYATEYSLELLSRISHAIPGSRRAKKNRG